VKIRASILVLTFLVLQYGKLASYWECRMSAASYAEYCECQKLLVDTHEKGNTETAPTAIAKEKTDESYQWETHVNNIAEQPVQHTPSSQYLSWIPGDHSQVVFQPPKI
jgi:hypothetical protein